MKLLSEIAHCPLSGYTGYLTNTTINGLISQHQNGSTIILEHRFYGLSNPYNNLTVSSLSVHTIQQAVDDLVYFAQNVQLPMPNGNELGPTKAPWILIGGSYSGALVSWTMNKWARPCFVKISNHFQSTWYLLGRIRVIGCGPGHFGLLAVF